VATGRFKYWFETADERDDSSLSGGPAVELLHAGSLRKSYILWVLSPLSRRFLLLIRAGAPDSGRSCRECAREPTIYHATVDEFVAGTKLGKEQRHKVTARQKTDPRMQNADAFGK